MSHTLFDPANKACARHIAEALHNGPIDESRLARFFVTDDTRIHVYYRIGYALLVMRNPDLFSDALTGIATKTMPHLVALMIGPAYSGDADELASRLHTVTEAYNPVAIIVNAAIGESTYNELTTPPLIMTGQFPAHLELLVGP